MIRSVVIALIFGLIAIDGFGQQALVGNENGQWFIYVNGQRNLLPKEIHELGNFDSKGLAFFQRYGKYGLMNEAGEVILKEDYRQIKQLGSGSFQLLKKDGQFFASYDGKSMKIDSCLQIKDVDLSWKALKFDSTWLLINLNSRKEFELRTIDEIKVKFDHVYIVRDESRLLLDPKGNEIKMGDKFPIFHNNDLVVDGVEIKKIVVASGEIHLPNDVTQIEIRGDDVFYSNGNQTTIASLSTKEVILVAPFGWLSALGDQFFETERDGRKGIINRKGEQISPPMYSFITYAKPDFEVRNSSGIGIIDSKGKQIVPCKYDWIRTSRDFYQVANELELQGVISRINGKTLLDCSYSRVMSQTRKIRGWSGDNLRILELDSTHNIVNDLVLKNVITLDNTTFQFHKEIDKRLFNLGWYYINEPRFDSLGFRDGEVAKWGLRGLGDTNLIEPKFPEPFFVPQAPFSLISTGGAEISYGTVDKLKVNTYSVTSHETGRRLVPESIYSVDTMDRLTRAYTRFLSGKGQGILLDNGNIIRVNHVDGYDTRFVRYCTSKKTVLKAAKKTDFDALEFPDLDQNNDPSITTSVRIENTTQKFIRYEGAEWNFLDTNGRTIFPKSFSFAYPYTSQTAIVKGEKGWGVAREDSLIIPMSFSSIKRVPVFSDTLFIVSKTPNGLRFTDSTGIQMSNGMTDFRRNVDDLSQIQIGNKKVIITPTYKEISGETKVQKLEGGNVFTSKVNTLYTIYDANGTQIGECKFKPEEILFGEVIVTKDRGKFGVCSLDGSTIIPFEFKEICAVGDYLFAKNGSENTLYRQNGEVIVECKSEEVLVDAQTGNYAVIDAISATLYDHKSSKKVAKVKGTNFICFQDNWIVDFGDQLRVENINGEKHTFDFNPIEITVMEGAGYLVQDNGKNTHYFTSDWQEKTFGTELRKTTYVGEGRAVASTKEGLLLFGESTEKHFEKATRLHSAFENGFILMEIKGEFEYYDVNGENRFKRSFNDATPFKGSYATVEDVGGWTIIDGKGHFKVLPSFGKLEQVGMNIFQTSSQTVHGLYDSHGNEFIPVKFQEINFLPNGIIQGISNGEIHYFDHQGNSIELRK